MEKCELCDEEVEEVYECERCGKNVCLGCTGDECPYNMTLCEECDSEFMSMYEDWLDYQPKQKEKKT